MNVNDCTQPYETLFDSNDYISSKEGCNISQYEYTRENFICQFDIDNDHGNYLNLKTFGHSSIEIDTRKYFDRFWNIFQVNIARNVII